MYYPLLRGRQNELLAIKELLDNGILKGKVVPIIEPVKLSPTLVNTLEDFVSKNYRIVLIRNPKVGSFGSDARNPKNEQYKNRIRTVCSEENCIIRGYIVDGKTKDTISQWRQKPVNDDSIVALCLNPDDVKYYNDARLNNTDIATVVPYAPSFRRIRKNKILIDDKFNKEGRNSDYIGNEDQFFSDDHLYFADDGYIGFSDYSIIGAEYSESGFAPYAVAIHIVYFDEEKALRIHHFVSDSNDDITDPAGKFYEALEKLIEWNKDKQLDTLAMKKFQEIYDAQSYPGLGVVKKLSIMHHLELVERFLDGTL